MKFDLVVVGGGIVGLATAFVAQRSGLYSRVCLVEKEKAVARHQTSHNSGVLHCGLYYKPGSLKARMAVDGLQMMLDFCRQENIQHEVCGKIVLATNEEEVKQLRLLQERGKANLLSGLKWLEPREIALREPNARGKAALLVPQEGIVDYNEVAQKMESLFKESGGEVILEQKVREVRRSASTQVVLTQDQEIETEYLVTCAGLQSDRVAQLSGEKLSSRIVPFRGDYYELFGEGESLVKHLIYPVPDPALPFLGVHFTRKLKGGIEAGPNAVLAFKREGYTRASFSIRDSADSLTYPGLYRFIAKYPKATLDEFRNSMSKRVFLRNLQKLVPDVELEHLRLGGASGVRAQAIDFDGSLAMDFRLVEGAKRIHVINAPSPAATASLAIGNHIVKLLRS